jgi:hypothetical protein
MFHVVQEGVGFDRLQTLFCYLKLPPLHIIPCWPDCLPSCRPELPPLCGRVWGVSSKTCVRLTDLVAMSATVIA